MDALIKRMNALCDAQPFQTSWYLHDLDRGPGRTGWATSPSPPPARERSPFSWRGSRPSTTASSPSTRR
jgi:hypothetical protein